MSSNKVLIVDNVKKSFSKNEILKGITFHIDEGEIVGFLGRNGAGKSTLMKLICGLLNLDSGEIFVLGNSIKTDREKVLENLGVSIESPALYENLTGRENLKLMANWRDIDNNRLKEMEEYSKLNHNLDKKVSKYSMGMKMRLMLSMVLLSKPKLLILDEPMNGLDPDGVMELRGEMENLKNQGSSILFSSHQLSEVEKISDRIVMIENGNVVFDGDFSSFDGNRFKYEISTDNNQKAEKILNNLGLNVNYVDDLERENYFETYLGDYKLDFIINSLKNVNIEILDIYKKTLTLEDLYKNLRN